MSQMNVEYFLNKFRNVPADDFVTGRMERGGRYDANAFCNRAEEKALTSLFRTHLGLEPFIVNDDGRNQYFPQSRAKYRLLAALHRIGRKVEIAERWAHRDVVIDAPASTIAPAAIAPAAPCCGEDDE